MGFRFRFLLLLAILLAIYEIPSSSSIPDLDLYKKCSNQFKCGADVADFPFWGGIERPRDCGHPALELHCENKTTTVIEIVGVRYKVLEFHSQTKRLKIARKDYEGGICPKKIIQSTTLNTTPFHNAPGYAYLTLLYGCPDTIHYPGSFNCSLDGANSSKGFIFPGISGPLSCFASATVLVPDDPISKGKGIEGALRDGFEVEWKVDDLMCKECVDSGGKCGFRLSSFTETVCYCREQSSSTQACRPQTASISLPATNTGKKSKVPLIVGLSIAGAAIAGILIGGWGLFILQRRKRIAAQSQSKDLPITPSSKGLSNSYPYVNRFQTSSTFSLSKSALENGSTYFGVQVFTYTELEEATNNFDPSKELGDGGFGTVYYGVLSDGRVVAVKRLYENNLRRAEQFLNEIKILADIRHPNLVTLFGCTSRHSKELLLVYEYIPNGTVADHLHGKKAKPGLLTWPVRLSIAIESANALAYLHAHDVIHRDVKTNNILLDNNFRVKVADFGLSRLFPHDINVTHVSTAPQGTPGYVDPEYYQCYHLTEKSDVYSFGVVLVELISSMQAVDTTRHRHDINLANMAVGRIQNQALHELVDPYLGYETDNAVRTMITVVAQLAFRCLQQERDMRPSMEEVLDVLRGMQTTPDSGAQIAEVVDIGADDVGLLKHFPPPLSPDSGENDKWGQIKTM